VRLHQREGQAGYLFVAPTTVLLTVFYLYPLARTLLYSVTNWNPTAVAGTHYVGLQNFVALFTSGSGFVSALWHTGVFVVVVVPVSLAGGLFLALLMDRPFRGRNLYRALIFAPFVAPTVGSALIFTYLLTPLGGLVNDLLGAFGVAPIAFLTSSPWAMVAVIIFSIWHEVGYTTLIYSAALAAIPPSYLEAATLDGAGAVRRFFSISMPLLNPTTVFLTITGVLTSLQAFTQVQVLTQGGPLNSTTTALYWIYQEGFTFLHGGLATAGAVVLLAIGLVVTLVQLRIAGRRDSIELT
jgi:multiple sugar transport system permease protein